MFKKNDKFKLKGINVEFNRHKNSFFLSLGVFYKSSMRR